MSRLDWRHATMLYRLYAVIVTAGEIPDEWENFFCDVFV